MRAYVLGLTFFGIFWLFYYIINGSFLVDLYVSYSVGVLCGISAALLDDKMGND